MGATVRDICSLIEDIAPLCLAENWDNVGLQAGSLKGETEKILFALDPSMEALERAKTLGAGLLITHHPLIFSPLRSFDKDCFPCDLVAKAVEMKLTIVSYHTNLDRAPCGINHALAEILELEEVTVLETIKERPGSGLGRIGRTCRPMSLADFADFVSQKLNLKYLRLVGNSENRITKAAVVGGSGGGFISAAEAYGADVLVTGDVGYHHALEARRKGLYIIDAGHFETEMPAFRLWVKGLDTKFKERGWRIDVVFFEDQLSPYLHMRRDQAAIAGIPERGLTP